MINSLFCTSGTLQESLNNSYKHQVLYFYMYMSDTQRSNIQVKIIELILQEKLQLIWQAYNSIYPLLSNKIFNTTHS